MLRRLGIRAKVLAVLAVPMLVLVGAGAYISNSALQDLRYARATQDLVRALEAMAPVTAAFQQERIASLTGAPKEQIEEARSVTDRALTEARRYTTTIQVEYFPDAVVADFRRQQTAYSTKLGQLRERVDTGAQQVIVGNAFADIVDGQHRVVEGVANALRDRELASYVSANLEVSRLVDSIIVQYIQGAALFAAQSDSPTDGRTFSATSSAVELARERARAAVAALELEGVALGAGDPSTQLLSFRAVLGTGSVEAIAERDPAQWTAETTRQLDTLSDVSGELLDAARVQASDGAQAARDTALITIALALAALAASFILAITVARSIVVPLRRLTSAAADVREQLPRLVEQVATPGEGPEITLAPIPVRSSDEVGRLAQAFNAVNATTVQVAQEQAALRGSIAEMFVNVARRDQVLLNRQLSFIDSLERAEEDPGTLANLFRLDHLATRMRRNAESLLVLAGIDSGRRLRDAMPLSDVIRTASSEIEQYDRVELDLQVDPHMLGFNALSAAHLIAELLENATVFSEPETPVVVSTGIVGGAVVVRIADQGLGMTDAEIEAANRKIVSVSASDALGAQRLGLFVVGRLAQRLGADVQLRKRAGGTGTEALVQFPSTLFSANEVGGYGALPPAAAPVSAPTQRVEAPEVREVDLAELTDGQTPLGLPRRRRGDEAEAAPVAPGAPVSDDDQPIPVPVLGGGANPLPSRSRKTFDEDNIVLPVAPSATLSPELADDSDGWTPAVVAAAPLSTGLPTRSRSSVPAVPDEPATPVSTSAAPADPAARAGLFSGFRTRDALAPEAPAQDAGPAFTVPGLEPDPTDAPADDWPAPSWAAAGGTSLPTRGEPAPYGASGEPTVDRSATEVDDESAHQWDQEPAASEEWSQPEPVAPQWAQPHTAEQPWEQAATDEQWSQPEVHPWVDAGSAGEGTEQSTSHEPEAWQGEPEPEAASDGPAAFPAYSGFSGWARGGTDGAQPEPYVPFGRSLDEARAWHTGTIPVVPAPQAEQPAWDAQGGAESVIELEPEPEAEDDVVSPWAPVAATQPPALEPDSDAPAVGTASPAAPQAPAWQAQEPQPWEQPQAQQPQPWEQPQAPAWQQPQQWEPPQQQPQPAAWSAQPQQPPAQPQQGEAPGWQPATPTWARSASVEQPTQMFSPVEAEEAVTRTTGFAPAATPAPDPVTAAPARPSWQPAASVGEGSAPATFGDIVGEDDRPRRRWGAFFSRRKDDAPAPAPQATETDGPRMPVRSSAWAPDASLAAPAAPVAPPAQAPAAPSWSVPAAPETAQPVAEQRPAPSWSPPAWAATPAPAPSSTVPSPTLPPSVAPRVGTLDDEVAAMLALRSDIQEQALSELSQLSAYRPSAVGAGSAERLTKRVPSAVPAAPEPTPEQPVQRDADQLRSRLSSFQSGTSRGRRAAYGEPGGDS